MVLTAKNTTLLKIVNKLLTINSKQDMLINYAINLDNYDKI